MPDYKYFFEDLTTGTLLDELPGLYGVYLSANMSAPGDWTGTIRMDNDYRTPTEVLEATMPGRTLVWVERDNEVIWGGIVWSRTYQSDGRTMQLQARSFDSYLGKDNNETDLAITDYKVNIVREMFRRSMETGTGAPFLLTIPSAAGSDGDSTYTKTIVGNEYTPYDDVVKEMVRGGVEYRILYAKDTGTNVRNARLEIGRWDKPGFGLGVPYSVGATRLLFQYPGDISKYWWPESVADTANKLYGIGKANEASTPRAILTNTASMGSGYPRLGKRYTYSQVETTTMLTALLGSIRDAVAPPQINPTFELLLSSATEDAAFGNWRLGDYFDYAIDDPYRFPTVRKGSTRVTGWTLRPQGSEGLESVGITTLNFEAQILQEGT